MLRGQTDLSQPTEVNHSVREAIKTSWRFLTTRQKVIYGLLILGRMASNLFDLLGIAAIGLLVMAVASGEIDFDLGGLYRIRVEETPPEFIAGLVVAAAVAFLLKASFNLLLSLSLVRFMAGIEVRASRRLADYLLSGSLGELRRFSQADINYAVNASTSAMYSGILNAIGSIISDTALMFTILAAFVLVNPTAAIVVFVYLAVVIVSIQYVIGERLKQIGRDVNDGSIASTSAILDSVASFREVAVLKKQPFFLRRFSDGRWLLAKTKAARVVLR